MYKTLIVLLLSLSLLACEQKQHQAPSSTGETITLADTSLSDTAIYSVVPPADSGIAEPVQSPPSFPDTTTLERSLLDQGLIDAALLEPAIQVEMKYSTEDNFLHEDVYGDFDKCYLQVAIATRLASADSILRSVHPDLRLLVYDCVRPRSVQYQMWEIVKGTPQQSYVAAPGGTGSMHNYGAAVDLTLMHVDTGELDMGTPFDFFGPLAQPRYEDQYKASGKLTEAQVFNRRLLRAAMSKAGFYGILSEWWHFVGLPRDVVKQKYRIVE